MRGSECTAGHREGPPCSLSPTVKVALRQGLGGPLFPTALLMKLKAALGISLTLFLFMPGLASLIASDCQSLRVSGQGTMGQLQLLLMCSVLMTHCIIWPHRAIFQIFLLTISFHQTKMVD